MKTPESNNGPHLSPQECRVGALVVQGLTDKEIAAVMGISVFTARCYSRSLATKFRTRNRVSTAFAYADWQGERTAPD